MSQVVHPTKLPGYRPCPNPPPLDTVMVGMTEPRVGSIIHAYIGYRAPMKVLLVSVAFNSPINYWMVLEDDLEFRIHDASPEAGKLLLPLRRVAVDVMLDGRWWISHVTILEDSRDGKPDAYKKFLTQEPHP